MKSLDIRLTDKEKRNQVLLCLDYTGLKVNAQGVFYSHPPFLQLSSFSVIISERKHIL